LNTPNISDYSRAWAEYNRRWAMAWSIPLIFLVCAFLIEMFISAEILGWTLGATFLVYCVLYLRFLRWPCPRCGKQFTMADMRRIERSDKCLQCGLPRNEIPETPSSI
jgi:hypothetical protein